MPRPADAEVFQALVRRFGQDVEPEWDVAKGSEDLFDRALQYAPRLDFAIRPFNTNARTNHEMRQQIVETGIRNLEFIEALHASSDIPTRNLGRNPNPRCFLAIELERETSRKDRLGGIINASAMGIVGIVVGADEDVYRSLVRLRGYLDYLPDVGKAPASPQNILIMTRQSFLDVLNRPTPTMSNGS